MTPEEIQAALERAQDIVNGFRTPNQRCARDAVRLAELCQVREKQINALRLKLETRFPSQAPDFLDGLFGGAFGKKGPPRKNALTTPTAFRRRPPAASAWTR